MAAKYFCDKCRQEILPSNDGIVCLTFHSWDGAYQRDFDICLNCEKQILEFLKNPDPNFGEEERLHSVCTVCGGCGGHSKTCDFNGRE